MKAVADAGVDLDDVFEALEDEGVQKFADSWDELTESVRSELEDKNERTYRTIRPTSHPMTG
jgi:transaldolase